MQRSILSTLLLFFVAIGFSGTQMLAVMIAPAEAAQEDPAAEEREEAIFRQATARRARARGQTVRLLFIKVSQFSESGWAIFRSAVQSRSLLQVDFSLGTFHLLQVCRI